MGNATLVRIGVLILLVIGGMSGVGIAWRQYFETGGREGNQLQDKRLDGVETTQKDHSDVLRQHQASIDRGARTDNDHQEAINEIKAVNQDQDKRIGEAQKRMDAQDESLQTLRTDLDAVKADNVENVKKLDDLNSKFEKEREERMEERKLQEARNAELEAAVARINRVLGLDDKPRN